MARVYSPHFTSQTVAALTDTPAIEAGYKASAGIAHARLRTKIVHGSVGTVGMASGDELRLCRFKSSDRIISIKGASDGGSTTYAADLGLYLAGSNGDGAVVDADLFASALAMATGFAFDAVDNLLLEATTLTDEDIGKTLWEMAAIGAATYTEDPKVEFDLVLTSTATGTAAINEYLFVVQYTSGD